MNMAINVTYGNTELNMHVNSTLIYDKNYLFLLYNCNININNMYSILTS